MDYAEAGKEVGAFLVILIEIICVGVSALFFMKTLDLELTPGDTLYLEVKI